MNLTFAAIDGDGRVVRDLRPDELQVFEDGSPVMLLDLDQRTLSVASSTRQGSLSFFSTLTKPPRRNCFIASLS